ncbi:hypothetical protein WJX77_002258 [Trebouxia sp. C0004]
MALCRCCCLVRTVCVTALHRTEVSKGGVSPRSARLSGARKNLAPGQHDWRTIFRSATQQQSYSVANPMAAQISHKRTTPRCVCSIDPAKHPWEQGKKLHNRWHPDIPHVDTVKEGECFRVETQDWTGGQIKDNDSAEDMKNIDLSLVHNLSGPFRVEDTKGKPAMPGDLLVVEILDLGPLEGHEWGFTGIFDRENGGGFLTDHFPEACKAIWDFEGIYCSSRHVPGVRFPGLIHPGLIGTAPSHELLKIWNDRERKLVEDGEKAVTLGRVLHTRPLANLPEPVGCLLGSMDKNSEEFKKAAKEAARTIPGREHGGNCDIKNLTKGCKVYFPVFIEGANLSMGDMHFSQGDGEVSFCGAIEMCAAFLTLKCTIMRGGMEQYLTPMGPTKLHVNPIFEISPLEPHFSEWLVFEGLSIDEYGRQHYLDASVAYKRAVLNCIHYLAKFGYTKQQIYLMLSCCPCEGRISGIVDAPNACCTLAIPTAIFDQDIRPCKEGPPVGPKLINRGDLAKCKYDGSLPLTKPTCNGCC